MVNVSQGMQPGVRRTGEPRPPMLNSRPALQSPQQASSGAIDASLRRATPPVSAQSNTVAVEEFTPTERSNQFLGSDWERIDLPSNFVFYEWESLSAKRFGPRDQAKLARAVKRRNFTTLLDVLSACCDRDVRELAYSDFQALCTWHKLNSYLNAPYEMSWSSRYGVRGKATIRKTQIRETKLSATRAEYLKWKEKGLATSTCQDLETLSSGALDEDTTYLFDKAQFIDPAPLKSRIEELTAAGDRIASVTARIEELERRGLKWFVEIEEFASEFAAFGMQEIASATIASSDFDATKAIAALRSTEHLEDAAEADVIAATVAAKETYSPKEEEVPLGFNLWTMFPYT